MRRLFLDANVIFTAAHNPEGNSRALLRLAGLRRIEVVSSRYAVEEAARNLAVKLPECAAAFDQVIADLVLVGEPGSEESRRATAHGLPAKDVPILAAALAAAASILVTGDRRHFGHLYGKTVDGIVVLTRAEALSIALTTSR